jgi:hypothetical protein
VRVPKTPEQEIGAAHLAVLFQHVGGDLEGLGCARAVKREVRKRASVMLWFGRTCFTSCTAGLAIRSGRVSQNWSRAVKRGSGLLSTPWP